MPTSQWPRRGIRGCPEPASKRAGGTWADTGPRGSAADLSSSLEPTTRLVGPAVVEIFTTSCRTGEGLLPRTADLVTTQRASGSGVIVDPAGYIVTNAHVVGGAQRLRVEIPIPVAGRSILARRSRTVSGQIVEIDQELSCPFAIYNA